MNARDWQANVQGRLAALELIAADALAHRFQSEERLGEWFNRFTENRDTVVSDRLEATDDEALIAAAFEAAGDAIVRTAAVLIRARTAGAPPTSA